MQRRGSSIFRWLPLLVIPACADLISAPESAGVILPPAAELVSIILTVDDISERILPGIGSEGPAGDLRTALTELRGALAAAEAQRADEAMRRARAALTAYMGVVPPAQGPDASVIDLSLLLVESSIKRPCATQSTATLASSFASCSSR